MWNLKAKCKCGGTIKVVTLQTFWSLTMTEIVSHGVCQKCLSTIILPSDPIKVYIINGLLEQDEWVITQ